MQYGTLRESLHQYMPGFYSSREGPASESCRFVARPIQKTLAHSGKQRLYEEIKTSKRRRKKMYPRCGPRTLTSFVARSLSSHFRSAFKPKATYTTLSEQA